jgi:hypothetical protein
MQFILRRLALAGCAVFLSPLYAQFSIGPAGAVFMVEGNQSALGAYHGQLELRPNPQGGWIATRVVQFDTFRFDGFQVQEVWTGSAQTGAGSIELSFSLKQADFFSSVAGQTRTPQQFATSFKLNYGVGTGLTPAAFTLTNGSYRETVEATAAQPGPNPLWSDQRRATPSLGESDPLISGVVFSTVFGPFMRNYRNDPVVKASLSQARCASKEQYIVRDPTDFDFLRAHPDVIRIVNKISDTVSFTEASMRTNAYGPTLEAKADVFDKDFPVHNLNPFGFYVWALYNDNGGFAGQSPNGDSDLYTGMYAASQAMRWTVTHEPVALENFKRAASALMLALDVTGDESIFARSVEPMPMTPAEQADPAWKQGAGPYQNMKYRMPGNNDMIKGVFLAFAWAFEILPEGDPFLAQVAAHSTRLLKLKSLRDSTPLTENHYLSFGLAALASGSKADFLKFASLYYAQITTMDDLGLETGFYYGGVGDWSGTNLKLVSTIARVLITKNIARRAPWWTFGVQNKMLAEARRNLMEAWATYSTVKRDALTVAAYTFGQRNSLGMDPKTAPASWSKMAGWTSSVDESLGSLREVPITNGTRDIQFDYRLMPDWCMSYWPASAWQVFAYKNPIEYYYQSKSIYPIFEGGSLQTENLWGSGFDFRGGGTPRFQAGRMDYLFMYWMARLSGLIAPAAGA